MCKTLGCENECNHLCQLCYNMNSESMLYKINKNIKKLQDNRVDKRFNKYKSQEEKNELGLCRVFGCNNQKHQGNNATMCNKCYFLDDDSVLNKIYKYILQLKL